MIISVSHPHSLTNTLTSSIANLRWPLHDTLCDSLPTCLQQKDKVLVHVDKDLSVSRQINQGPPGLVGTDTPQVVWGRRAHTAASH